MLSDTFFTSALKSYILSYVHKPSENVVTHNAILRYKTNLQFTQRNILRLIQAINVLTIYHTEFPGFYPFFSDSRSERGKLFTTKYVISITFGFLSEYVHKYTLFDNLSLYKLIFNT